MKKYSISLEYCVPGNYATRAVSVTEDILFNYQHIIEDFVLITGSKGAFEFKVNGDLLFSKKRLGRHAEPGEMLKLFKELVGTDVATYPQSNGVTGSPEKEGLYRRMVNTELAPGKVAISWNSQPHQCAYSVLHVCLLPAEHGHFIPLFKLTWQIGSIAREGAHLPEVLYQ